MNNMLGMWLIVFCFPLKKFTLDRKYYIAHKTSSSIQFPHLVWCLALHHQQQQLVECIVIFRILFHHFHMILSSTFERLGKEIIFWIIHQ